MKSKLLALPFIVMTLGVGLASAQGVLRCESADGKIEYAERCSGPAKSRALNDPKEPNSRDADAQRKKTARDEADFQKRHAAREKLAAQERRDKARIARDNARTNVLHERAELAKAREKRLADQNLERAPRRLKNAPAR